MKVDLSLDWNLARSSGGKNAAPLPTVSTLLVSVPAQSGEFTNWWIIDGTSSNPVTFHLDNGVGNRRNLKSRGVLWNELQGVAHVPSGGDDGGARNRKRAETERAQSVTVVKRQAAQCNWNISISRGLGVHGAHQNEHDQIGVGKELTGVTAAFSVAIMDPCITENMISLYDTMTPNDSRR